MRKYTYICIVRHFGKYQHRHIRTSFSNFPILQLDMLVGVNQRKSQRGVKLFNHHRMGSQYWRLSWSSACHPPHSVDAEVRGSSGRILWEESALSMLGASFSINWRSCSVASRSVVSCSLDLRVASLTQRVCLSSRRL